MGSSQRRAVLSPDSHVSPNSCGWSTPPQREAPTIAHQLHLRNTRFVFALEESTLPIGVERPTKVNGHRVDNADAVRAAETVPRLLVAVAHRPALIAHSLHAVRQVFQSAVHRCVERAFALAPGENPELIERQVGFEHEEQLQQLLAAQSADTVTPRQQNERSRLRNDCAVTAEPRPDAAECLPRDAHHCCVIGILEHVNGRKLHGSSWAGSREVQR